MCEFNIVTITVVGSMLHKEAHLLGTQGHIDRIHIHTQELLVASQVLKALYMSEYTSMAIRTIHK